MNIAGQQRSTRHLGSSTVCEGWDISADSPLLRLGTRGRGRFTIEAPEAKGLSFEPRLLAGAAEVDITPPPGMPKAGYSANAHDGNGFRTRLHAHVIHLRCGYCSLALVQCDLLGGSAVVQQLVARAIAERTDVPVAGVFIGATHTHAGPGQFLGTDFYNRFASNRAGFDPAWTQFLCERISAATIDAVQAREPACLGVGTARVWGLTRNRSHPAHIRNESVADKRVAPQRKFGAVNPVLYLIRVDADRRGGAGRSTTGDDGTEPMAAAVLFSVHGTGISMRARQYNADLWAYVKGTLARAVERSHGTRPVVGAMQASHADVAPAIRPGAAGYLEARRVGVEIGEQAAALYEELGARLASRVELRSFLRQVDLDRHPKIGGVALPARPAIGAALVAGAKENATPILGNLPPFRAGTPRPHRRGDPQGAKWVLGSRWLQGILFPTRVFPRVLPLQLLRIGDLAIMGLPFEVTVEAGRRIANKVAEALCTTGVREVTVSSVANEYSGYVTTPEEYALQYYEGGHTIYGPLTQVFLAAHARDMAVRLARSDPQTALTLQGDGPRSFDLRLRRFLPETTTALTRRSFVGEARFVDPTPCEDGFWELDWLDGPPGSLAWHRPLVRVESSSDGQSWRPAIRRGVQVDDEGWDLEVTHVGSRRGGDLYRVRWHDPDLGGDRRHRLVLLANSQRPEVVSAPFD